MLLIEEQYDLEPLSGSENRKCSCGSRATWRGRLKDGATVADMCGWCVLYAGSEWGHDNREEIQDKGILIRQAALASRSKKTHVPELDERHRLSKEDGERFMLGVGFTSHHLRSRLASIFGKA